MFLKKKCECPNSCDICNEMMTQKNLCKCARQHVKLLATKISKSISGGSEEQCGQLDYIPDSEQVGVSDIIDRHFDSLDLRPPDPGETVEMGHCSNEQKVLIQKLMKEYESAFA